MEFTKTMQQVMERAVGLAREEGHRYFMPEHILYGMTSLIFSIASVLCFIWALLSLT